jgi:thiol:disulfide interchange protein DsbD
MHTDANFGNTTVYFGDITVPVSVNGDLSGLKTLDIAASFQGCQDGGVCYPVMTRDASVGLGSAAQTTGQAAENPAPEMPPASAGGASASLLYQLLLAVLGGLVLNLMPCVLPVLSIKAVGILESGDNLARRRTHALMYTAGVLISFVALGLVIIALKTAWGAHLQNPLVVAVLSLVMLAVALSMSGVVQFGASLGNTGSSLANRSGPIGDFFTGVLAVVVASPCTAPFMGTALAYALVAPTLNAMAVFFALGLGLALPFLAIGFIPALSRWLPRPGRWMETLKEILAFPMYLTAAWLAWVLAHQRGADAVGLLMVAAVLLAMTLWWFERSRGRGLFSRAWVVVLALFTLAPLYYLSTLPATAHAAETSSGVVAYSPEKLDALRKAGTPVFVDMTADWCVTCKANEHTVLDGDAFQALLKRTGTVYMKGDWTDVNPTISAFLEQYHSPGVPLYVVFPKNGGPGHALPTVLTESLVEDAVNEAAK